MVERVVGRCDIVQRAVLVGFLHLKLEDVEAVVNLKVAVNALHVERIELRLGLLQGRFHLAGLQHLVRVVRTYAQRLSSVNDILAQSERQARNAFLRLLVAYGVIVYRAQHARHVRIVTVAVLLANHFLQYDGHLLLVDDVARGCHISLRVLIIHRGVNALDGGGKHLQHLILVVKVRYHVSGVDTGERLVVGVFQKA